MKSLSTRIRPVETPIHYRIFVALWGMALACTGCTSAANRTTTMPARPVLSTHGVALAPSSPDSTSIEHELTEADVVRLAIAQDPDAIAARQVAQVAEARRSGTGLYPNPTLSWDREHFPNHPNEREDAFSVTVPVALSTRRATRRYLASAKVSAAQARAERTQTQVVVRALNLFYDLVAQQQRIGIQEHASERLHHAARVVTRQQAEGRISGYDQVRIEIEAELAASELAQSRSRETVLRRQLALLLGIDNPRVATSSAIQPNDTLPVETDTAPAKTTTEISRMLHRPSLRLLRTAESETRAARDAATLSWIPKLSINGGLIIGSAQDTRYGYIAGVAIDVPLFSRGQGLRQQTRAQARLARTRVQAAERSAEQLAAQAQQTLVATRAELLRFDQATRDRVGRLERAAESGYREGHRSIVELLDARRARTSVETRRVELSLSVKRAEVALRAALGDFEGDVQ